MGRELSYPTGEQYEEFTQHVCWAHSWYKHIPLLGGADIFCWSTSGLSRLNLGIV